MNGAPVCKPQHLAHDLAAGADALRGKVQPAGFDLRELDQVLDAVRRRRRRHDQHAREQHSGVIGWKSLTGSKRTSVEIAGMTANKPLLARNSV